VPASEDRHSPEFSSQARCRRLPSAMGASCSPASSAGVSFRRVFFFLRAGRADVVGAGGGDAARSSSSDSSNIAYFLHDGLVSADTLPPPHECQQQQRYIVRHQSDLFWTVTASAVRSCCLYADTVAPARGILPMSSAAKRSVSLPAGRPAPTRDFARSAALVAFLPLDMT